MLMQVVMKRDHKMHQDRQDRILSDKLNVFGSVHDFAVYIQLHTRYDIRYPIDLQGTRYCNFFCYTVFRIPSGNSFVFLIMQHQA